MPELQQPRTIRLEDLSRAVGGEVHGAGETIIAGVSSLEEARSGDLAFVASDRFVKAARASQAIAFVVGKLVPDLPKPQIVVVNPVYAFTRIVREFFTEPYRPRGISTQSVLGTDVRVGPEASIWPLVTIGDRVAIGARVTLYPGVFIGDDSTIGDDCIFYPNVTVRERCVIGNRVIIHSGTVVGSDGFGYVQDQGCHHKIPQVGTVLIEDDVELGANVTIDRATFGQTIIRRGTKVDNLVQIAHNVSVGEHSILVAQVGIAGSTTLGHHVIVGGQAGLAGHLTIEDGVRIAAQSGVNRNVTQGQIVSGSPVMPHEVFLKAQAVIPRLPDMRHRLRELEERMKVLEARQGSRPKPKQPHR